METLLKVILFFFGWMSGGGILSFIAMRIITSLFGTDFNQMFLGGCLWGAFGVFGGSFMVSCMNMKQAEHPEKEGIEV